MEFIDRDVELAQLEKEYARDGSSFVVMYGRRRVGKTELLKHFIDGKDAIYFLATEESDEINRIHFQQAISHLNPLLGGSDVFSWRSLFSVVFSDALKEKRIIVIDEFQYLPFVNKAFLSILQEIWDEKLKNENIMLIVCGSLIRMMWSTTLNITSPLYGRRTLSMRIHPIPFKYYNNFYKNSLSRREAVELYSVTGGVPKYIEMLNGYQDVYKAIEERILDTSSILLDEPETILRREVSSVGTYFSILGTIALGNEKLGDISAYLSTEKSALTAPLSTLIDLDIVERVIPITFENPEKCKKGLYKIKDPYFRFWFRFIYPNMAELNMGRKRYVMDRIHTNLIDCHTAYIYEDICREKLANLNEDGKLPFSFNRIGSWWDKSTEIDLLAYDSFGQDICFGECKFKTSKIGVEVFHSLFEKAKAVDWKKEERKEWYVLFSIAGFTDELIALSKERTDLLLFN
jgi:uncharacterized protein